MQGEIELNLVNEYSIVKIASKPNLPYLFKFSEIKEPIQKIDLFFNYIFFKLKDKKRREWDV